VVSRGVFECTALRALIDGYYPTLPGDRSQARDPLLRRARDARADVEPRDHG